MAKKSGIVVCWSSFPLFPKKKKSDVYFFFVLLLFLSGGRRSEVSGFFSFLRLCACVLSPKNLAPFSLCFHHLGGSISVKCLHFFFVT